MLQIIQEQFSPWTGGRNKQSAKSSDYFSIWIDRADNVINLPRENGTDRVEEELLDEKEKRRKRNADFQDVRNAGMKEERKCRYVALDEGVESTRHPYID